MKEVEKNMDAVPKMAVNQANTLVANLKEQVSNLEQTKETGSGMLFGPLTKSTRQVIYESEETNMRLWSFLTEGKRDFRTT